MPSAIIASLRKSCTYTNVKFAFPALLTAVLTCLCAPAGTIAIPGTPVPITLQTLVLMMMSLLFNWRQVACGVVLYLSLGACGLPVFAGGGSTLALVGPSAGFLFGFIPSVIVCSRISAITVHHAWLRLARNTVACILGFLVVGYACGISVQAVLTGMPLSSVALASIAFIPGDLMKAAISATAITVLQRER